MRLLPLFSRSSSSRAARAYAIALAASFLNLGTLANAGADPAPTPTPTGPTPTATAESDAEARFREGSEAFDKGHTDEACTDFGASLRLYPTLGTLLNLALCHETEGKTASAWREFTLAAAWASQDPNGERREFAHQHAVRLEHSLSRLMLDVADGSRGVSVQIDGAAVDSRTALPLYLDPGPHVLVASAPGRKTLTQTVTVPKATATDAVSVRVPALDPLADSPAASSEAASDDGGTTTRRTAAYAVGGTGAVLFAVGLYFGIDAISKTQSLGARCGSCDSGPATASAAASLVTLSLGAAGLVVGAYLWATPPPAPPKRTAFAPLLLRVTPVLTPTSASVRVGLDL